MKCDTCMVGKLRNPMEYLGKGMWWCPNCGILYDQKDDKWIKPKPQNEKIKFPNGVFTWIKIKKQIQHLIRRLK